MLIFFSSGLSSLRWPCPTDTPILEASQDLFFSSLTPRANSDIYHSQLSTPAWEGTATLGKRHGRLHGYFHFGGGGSPSGGGVGAKLAPAQPIEGCPREVQSFQAWLLPFPLPQSFQILGFPVHFISLFIYYAEVPFPLVIDVLDASVGLPTLLLFFDNEISDKETYYWNASSSSTRHFYTIG